MLALVKGLRGVQQQLLAPLLGCPAVPPATAQLYLLGLRRAGERETSFGKSWYKRGWIEDNTSCLLGRWTTVSWNTWLFRSRTKIHLIKTLSFPGTNIKKVEKGMKNLQHHWWGQQKLAGREQQCPASELHLPCRSLYHLFAFLYLLFPPPFPLIFQLCNSLLAIRVQQCTRCCLCVGL